MQNHRFYVAILIAMLFACTVSPLFADTPRFARIRKVGLDEAVQEAMDNNHLRPASRFAVAMAEAQHRQALAAYWPQLSVQGGFKRMDEPLNFLFPANSFSTPLLPVEVDIPAQDVKLMEEESYSTSLKAQWLLYDGGMRKGYCEQARANLEMMKEEARRTDLEIIDSVTRYYYGAVLARRLHQVGMDTLARMEATLNLTEAMYREGSGKVKKTDWLDNKVMVESLRAMVALLEKNEGMSQAALANSMGLPWSASVCPVDQNIPFKSFAVPLEDLVSATYQFNPDWARIEAGIRAAKGALRTAKSGLCPKVALTGEMHKWWNDYDEGLGTGNNKEGWSVGIGIELPLFDGFLTRARVAESRAREGKIKEQKILLKEGLGLQVRNIFLSLAASEKANQATLEAMKAAVDNRDLNTRAYQHGLVETEEVIRAQLMESLMSAQHYKAQFDHMALQSRLNLVVGTQMLDVLEGK